ncbi:MAG: effector-associated domain EAD1-containing protein [Caldilineaceae bacterium]
MSLTGPQYQQLQDALLHAFDEPSLKRMVRFGLGEDLAAIAGGASFAETVFELIGWAERSGRTAEFVAAAAAAVPHNPELQAFVTQNPALGQPVSPPAPPAARKAWLVVEGMEFFAALPGAQVRVTANVNGTEYVYPSVGGVEWLEVGPGMSAQKFRLPPASDEYIVRFAADVRVPGKGKQRAITGKLTSVAEDIVHVAGDIPYAGRYVLHTFDPVHMARSADANAELSYRITYDP